MYTAEQKADPETILKRGIGTRPVIYKKGGTCL